MKLINNLGEDARQCLRDTETLMIIQGGVFNDLYEEAFTLNAEYDEFVLSPYPAYDEYVRLRRCVSDLMFRIGDAVEETWPSH